MRNWLYRCLISFLFFIAASAFAQPKVSITGMTEWEKMEISATVTLDLASAGFRMPVGRTQGEAAIASEFTKLMIPGLLNIQVDSSSNIADLVQRGELTIQDIENLALQSRVVPPALSPDLSSLLGFYTLDMAKISSALIRHNHPSEILRTLNPIPAPAYTGIVIIAAETLPVHSMRSSALIQPCLFPKIWDTEMNLIFERNMFSPRNSTIVRYFPIRAIFSGGPSGLSPEIAAIVGERPLRIFARGVFGTHATDPIISREDALLIISTEMNRNLLREGRIAIILDDSVLKYP